MRPGTLLRYYALNKILERTIGNSNQVIDIGGYDGFIANKLKRAFPFMNITVVDMDRAGLDQAHNIGLSTLYASAVDLPLQDNLIDVILCLDVIEHIREDTLLIHEVSRVLREDGIVVLTTPCENGITFPFLSKYVSEAINMKWGHLRQGYSIERIRKLFELSYLSIVETGRYFNIISRFFYRFSIITKIPFMGFFFRTCLLLEPYVKLGAQEHIIIARKLIRINETPDII